jgi:hypothetical protein
MYAPQFVDVASEPLHTGAGVHTFYPPVSSPSMRPQDNPAGMWVMTPARAGPTVRTQLISPPSPADALARGATDPSMSPQPPPHLLQAGGAVAAAAAESVSEVSSSSDTRAAAGALGGMARRGSRLSALLSSGAPIDDAGRVALVSYLEERTAALEADVRRLDEENRALRAADGDAALVAARLPMLAAVLQAEPGMTLPDAVARLRDMNDAETQQARERHKTAVCFGIESFAFRC